MSPFECATKNHQKYILVVDGYYLESPEICDTIVPFSTFCLFCSAFTAKSEVLFAVYIIIDEDVLMEIWGF